LRAQAARGADFRGLRRKLSLVVPVLGTLFERSFARAEVLAEAMEARGYQPAAPRTYYRLLKWTWRDLAAALAVSCWIGCALALDRGTW
jgi:energy-coupling factor transport system permease protein